MSKGVVSDNGQLSSRQFMILVILCTVGDSILILPMLIASASKQDAWLTMLLSLVLGLGVGVLYGLLAKRMKGLSLIAFVQDALGKAAGSVVCILFIIYFIYLHITLTSEMCQFMTTQFMPETPNNAIFILFIAVVIIAYRLGVEAFARMGELLFPVFMLLFIFMVVFLLPQIEIDKLEPVLAEGIKPVMNGILSTVTIPFTELIVILMLVPHYKGITNTMKPLLMGIGIGGLILFVTVLLCVLVLGPSVMESKYYPTFVLAQKITVGSFLERMEAILAFMWVITVYYKTLLIFYAITKSIEQLFGLKESNMLTIPLAMLLLVGSVIGTPNIVIYNEIIKTVWSPFDVTICLLLPALLLGWSYIRRNREKKAVEQNS